MSVVPFRLVPDPTRQSPPCPGGGFRDQPLGGILLRLGLLDLRQLDQALALQHAAGQRLGAFLVARGWITAADRARALALQRGTDMFDPVRHRPDPPAIDRLTPGRCLALGVLPLTAAGAVTPVATARPHQFEGQRHEMEAALGPVRPVIASERQIVDRVLELRGAVLSRRAELRVPEAESCRTLGHAPARIALAGAAAAAGAGAILAPALALFVLSAWAIFTLALTTGLRTAAVIAELARLRHRRSAFRSARASPAPSAWPVISLIVPLYRESGIVTDLVERLRRIDYPPERLDVLLVTEADDPGTRGIAARALPPYMRIVTSPRGTLRTKPRAMNVALDLCRGEIVGVYDAEDAPSRDQLRLVAHRFAEAPPEVACLQGVLDFYNARDGWMARAFAIDYAAWFRLVLPGLERLGLPVPLGGTTVFFRRAALEALGGWDAQNVTEDADLGIRLARRGFRTELIGSVTEEEANCRPLAWIRQRSRWQKGYALTWAAHMRRPLALWRDLGAAGFLSVQVLFLGSLSQALLAPILWSFWAMPLGLPHPLEHAVPRPVVAATIAILLVSGGLSLLTWAIAVSAPSKRWLLPSVPLQFVYGALGTLSVLKAATELVVSPFYWDKTAHGLSRGTGP